MAAEAPKKSPRETREWDEERIAQLERALAAMANQFEAERGSYIDDEDVQAVKARGGSR